MFLSESRRRFSGLRGRKRKKYRATRQFRFVVEKRRRKGRKGVDSLEISMTDIEAMAVVDSVDDLLEVPKGLRCRKSTS